MNFETIKCQVSFFYGRLTFSLPLFVQVYQQRKFWFSLSFLSTSTNCESFGFYWRFCPSLPTVKVLIILATISFTGHFGYEYQRWNFCDLEFAYEQPLASHSAIREFAFAGGNLWHPTVKTGVRTLGGNCGNVIRHPHMYVDRQGRC